MARRKRKQKALTAVDVVGLPVIRRQDDMLEPVYEADPEGRPVVHHRTVDTLGRLLPRFPSTEFVWIAGYDNALTFHHWHRWRTILDLMALAFVARPPALSLTRNFPLKSWAGQGQLWLEKSHSVPLKNNLTYWIISNKLNNQSSSTLRGKKVP